MNITASGDIPVTPAGAPGGNLRGSNSVWPRDPISFGAGDYIGIYIIPTGGLGMTGARIKDGFEIEGTIYLRFDNVSMGENSAEQVEW